MQWNGLKLGSEPLRKKLALAMCNGTCHTLQGNRALSDDSRQGLRVEKRLWSRRNRPHDQKGLLLR
jgi:hypothetical protein